MKVGWRPLRTLRRFGKRESQRGGGTTQCGKYDGFGGEAPWRDLPYPGIRWRDANGSPRPDWTQAPSDPAPDAAIWPEELRDNDYFLRQGNAFSQGHDPESGGDFFSLKQFNPNYQPADSREYPLRDALIRTYQYLIARFDIDGYRIDTLKYLPRDFARVFGNAIREYALSIGKENFFTFGEVYDDETKIAAYIGRNACSDDGRVSTKSAVRAPRDSASSPSAPDPA